jgi:pyruvate, water dikinase
MDSEKFEDKNILWFKDVSISDVPSVGGKGASLGELFSLAPIPDGFVVTAHAFGRFLEPIKRKVYDILDIVDVEETEKLDKASEKIRYLIMGETLSKDLKKEILDNYKNLRGFVAVRSSATAEDLPEASFAGQQDTYLNINQKGLLDAVQKCWASLFTSRAIYYREKNNFKHEDVLIAVVVQKMVDSKKAGVLFTANVVTNNKSEIIIEGAFGLGELVVSGQVTPDYYLIEKKNSKIKEMNINDQETGLFMKKNGGTEKRTIKDPSERVLSEKELKELTELSLKIEKHYKHPQDIEWAIDDKLYILQSRPITTLK